MPDLESKIALGFRGHAVIFTAAVSHRRSFSAIENFNGVWSKVGGVGGPRAQKLVNEEQRLAHIERDTKLLLEEKNLS